MPRRQRVFGAPAPGRKHNPRKDHDAFYTTARWKRVRKAVLARDPACVDPYGLHPDRVVPTEQIDHIIPLRQAPHLAYTLSNLQGLCRKCHGRKSREERDG